MMDSRPDTATLTDDAIRAELNAWLDAHWTVDASLPEWRERLVVSGWGAPTWPVEHFGRGLTPAQAALVEGVFRDRGIVGVAAIGPRGLASHTILAHGNGEQKRRFLPGILSGLDIWCQLFSEPGSGSDLAGLTTRAERRGEDWIVNGQKVWNTSAAHADRGLLVARTDWDVPKHQGISYFLIDMHQPGIEVRPLRQMNHHASFNEVFMVDAHVSGADLLGAEGEGWRIAATTLSIERQGFSRDRSGGTAMGLAGRIYDEYRAEVAIANEPYTWYPQRTGRADLALPRALRSGRIEDPAVRQELARLLCLKTGAELAARSAAAQARAGSNEVIPAGSIGKLAASLIARQASHVHTMISGSDALFEGEDSELAGVVAEILLSTPAISIAGGTDEIQKNIIAERVLGMPKEPRMDTGPFRDVARNVGQ